MSWNVENIPNVKRQMLKADKTGCAYQKGLLYSFRRAAKLRNVIRFDFSHWAPQENVEIFDPERNQVCITVDWTVDISLSLFLSLTFHCPFSPQPWSSLIWGTDRPNINPLLVETKEETHEDVIRDLNSLYKLLRAGVNTQNKAFILQMPLWTLKECSGGSNT